MKLGRERSGKSTHQTQPSPLFPQQVLGVAIVMFGEVLVGSVWFVGKSYGSGSLEVEIAGCEGVDVKKKRSVESEVL